MAPASPAAPASAATTPNPMSKPDKVDPAEAAAGVLRGIAGAPPAMAPAAGADFTGALLDLEEGMVLAELGAP